MFSPPLRKKKLRLRSPPHHCILQYAPQTILFMSPGLFTAPPTHVCVSPAKEGKLQDAAPVFAEREEGVFVIKKASDSFQAIWSKSASFGR